MLQMISISNKSCSLELSIQRILKINVSQFCHLESEGKKKRFEKIAFKVVQMRSLATHITNEKFSFDIIMVGNVKNIFMEHDLILMIFGIKEK